MRIQSFTARTDPGRRRRRNEDAFVVDPPLFAVADGMGGPRAGEVASRLAAAAVKAETTAGSGKERVVAAFQAANRSVFQRSSEDEKTSGMGTTMTVALFEEDGVTIGHVGDSRAYLSRGDEIEQLTDDHSLVAELVRGGKLSPEEAENHPQRSVITRALGTDPDIDVDVFVVEPEPGDVFLICSDGLTGMLDDATIQGVLEEHRGRLEQAAKALVREANRAGGEDNITVVAFTVTDEPEAQEELDKTREQALPPEAELEDTLTEADHVPVVGGPDGRPARKRRLWPLGVLLLAIVVAAVVLWFLAR
jgi:serine/threonine protein phosphatase PrpC